MSLFLDKAKRFFKSPLYPALFAALIFLGWVARWEQPVLYIVCALTAFILFTQESITAALPPILLVTYVFHNNAAEVNFAALLLPTVPVITAALIFFIIKNKVRLHLSPFSIGLIAALIGVIPGGLFFEKLPLHFLAPIAICALLVGLYHLFCATADDSFKDTLLNTLTALVFLLLFQSVAFYAMQPDPFYAFARKHIELGWGLSNNIALIMSMLIPLSFYRATEGKVWFFVPLAFVQLLMIFIVLSRGNMIFASLLFLPMLIFSYRASPHKKTYRITLGIIAAAGLVSLIWTLPYIQGILSFLQEKGLTGHGRMPLYAQALADFKLNPIFGVGFYYPGDTPTWYHNTVLHLLACLGVFGLLMFLPLFWQRYTIPLKKYNTSNLFMLFSLALFELYALMEINFFFVYTNLIVLSIYVIIGREKHTTDLTQVLKNRLLRKKNIPRDNSAPHSADA